MSTQAKGQKTDPEDLNFDRIHRALDDSLGAQRDSERRQEARELTENFVSQQKSKIIESIPENDPSTGFEAEVYAHNPINTDMGGHASEKDIRQLLNSIQTKVGGDVNDAALSLKEDSHPIKKEPDFFAEYDTDFGFHQFEMAGEHFDNPADTLYEGRRLLRNAIEGAKDVEGLGFRDQSVVSEFMFPEVDGPLNIEKFFQEVIDMDDVQEMDKVKADLKRYQTFVDVDGDHFHSIAAPMALHLNAQMATDNPDKYISDTINHHYLQQHLGAPFANGPIIQENSSGVHEGRIPEYDTLLMFGRGRRPRNDDGEVITDWKDELDADVPIQTNLNYMDLIDHGKDEQVRGIEDVLHMKMEGPLKQLDGVDPQYIQFEDSDIDPESMFDEEVWVKVEGTSDDVPNFYDLIADGEVDVKVQNQYEGKLVLPDDEELRMEFLENAYENVDSYTRGSLDLKHNGLVESRQFSTNIDRINQAILTATGEIRNLENVLEAYHEAAGLEDPEEYRESGNKIDREGPDTEMGSEFVSGAGLNDEFASFGKKTPRSVYREILPEIAEGITESFPDQGLPYTMETVLQNQEELGEYDSFRELLDDNFDTIEEFLVFNESVIEPEKVKYADMRAYDRPEQRSYSVEDNQSAYDDFKDWFVETAYMDPMEHFLDPEVGTGSQQIEEQYDQGGQPEGIMADREAKVI